MRENETLRGHPESRRVDIQMKGELMKTTCHIFSGTGNEDLLISEAAAHVPHVTVLSRACVKMAGSDTCTL